MSKITRSTVGHIDFIDCLRGIAIIVVFLYHCLALAFGRVELPWGEWFRVFSVSRSFHMLFPLTFGWAGVAIFFVVSGFCIHLSFERSTPPRLLTFYIRRFFRIYPPYLIALIFFALILPISKLNFNSGSDWIKFVSHIVFFQTYNNEWLQGINSAFWSIAVEVQLYLIYPTLRFLVKKLGWRYSLFIIGVVELGMRIYSGICLVSRNGMIPLPVGVITSAFFYWFSWSIGAKVADDFIYKRKSYFAKSSLALWFLLCLTVNCIKPLTFLSFPFASIITAICIAKLLNGERIVANVPPYIVKQIRLAGIWSYSIYLLHLPFLKIIPAIFSQIWPNVNVHPNFLFAAGLLSWFIILPISICFYYYYELPAIKFGKAASKKISRS